MIAGRIQGFMSVLLLVFLLVKINLKSQKGIYSDLNDRLLLSKDAVCTGRSHRTTGHTIWDMLVCKISSDIHKLPLRICHLGPHSVTPRALPVGWEGLSMGSWEGRTPTPPGLIQRAFGMQR